VEFIEIFEALPVEKKLRSPILPVFCLKSPRIIVGNKSLMVRKRASSLKNMREFVKRSTQNRLTSKNCEVFCPAKFLARLLCLGFRSAQRCQTGIQTF